MISERKYKKCYILFPFVAKITTKIIINVSKSPKLPPLRCLASNIGITYVLLLLLLLLYAMMIMMNDIDE